MAGAVATPHIPIRLEWLARRGETILEPELPIIDAHHHLWDRPESRYMPAEFRDDVASGHDIRATVYVQCHSFYRSDGPAALRSIGEVEHVAQSAARADPAGGRQLYAAIVGGADLTLGDKVAPVLEAMEAASGGRLRGIRNRVAWHTNPAIRSGSTQAPPDLLRDARFRQGVSQLAKLGLVLDVWVYQTQLIEVRNLAIAFPNATIVIDHLGGPLHAGRDAQLTADWEREMRALARLPNLRVKLGGLGMRVAGYRFHEQPIPPSSLELATAWEPWIMTCIEIFGPERCMFESNFPVDKGMAGYVVLWNTFKRLTISFTAAERNALFSGTASAVYRIAA